MSSNTNKPRRESSTRGSRANVRQRVESIKNTASRAKEKVKDLATKAKHTQLQGLGDEEAVPMYSPPRQMQEWDDTQHLPHVNWGDLFFDLFYVAAAYNLGALLKADPTPMGMLYFFALFLPVMGMWLDKMNIDARYVFNDHAHRIWDMIRLCIIAIAVLHIRPIAIMSDPKKYASFAFGLALTLDIIHFTIIQLEIYFYAVGGKAARIAAWSYLKRRWPGMIITLVGFAYATIRLFGEVDDKYDKQHRLLAEAADAGADSASQDHFPVICYFAGAFLNAFILFVSVVFCFPGGGKHKEKAVPMNIDFCLHRYGEWIMLMLGESVLSLLIVDVKESVDYYVTFFSGIIGVIMLQYLHFQSQPHHAAHHAMRRSKDGGIGFAQTFIIYSAALIALGASYKMMLYEIANYSDAATSGKDGYGDKYGDKKDGYGYGSDDYNSGKPTSYPTGSPTVHSRLLAAAGGGYGSGDRTEKRQQIADVFCTSMAMVFLTLEWMTILHKGLKANLSKLSDEGATARQRFFRQVLVIVKIATIAFASTLSQWYTDPEWLAFTGMWITIALVVMKIFEWNLFMESGHEDGGDSSHGAAAHGHGHGHGHGHAEVEVENPTAGQVVQSGTHSEVV